MFSANILNSAPPTDSILFQPNCLWMFPLTGLTKGTYWDFEISNLILKNIEICVSMESYGSENFDTFDLVLMFRFIDIIWCICLKVSCNSEMPSRRGKRSEICYFGVVVISTCDIFDLLVLKVILRHSVYLSQYCHLQEKNWPWSKTDLNWDSVTLNIHGVTLIL